MPTGREIRLAIGRILKGLPDGDNLFYEFVNSGTATASLTDAVNLASTKFTAQEFEDYIVRWSDASGASPDGAKVRATTLVGSTGVLSVSPSLPAAAANAETGELWKPPLDPDNVDRGTDRALSQLCTRWRLVPLGLLVDPDFLVDDLADATPTNWAASSATATVTNRSGVEKFSERVLRVANSGADGYAGQTVNTNLGEGGSEGEARDWIAAALVQADVGTASMIMRDLSNSADLTLSGDRDSWAGEGFQLLRHSFTVPATCEQISARLHGAEASADCYWGPVSLYPKNARQFVLPARITSVSQVGPQLVEYVGGSYPELVMRDVAVQPKVYDAGGNIRVQLNDGPIGDRMLFFREFANYSALGSTYNTQAARAARDAVSTSCPLDYVVWATMYAIFGEKYKREFEDMHRRRGARGTFRFVHPQGEVIA